MRSLTMRLRGVLESHLLVYIAETTSMKEAMLASFFSTGQAFPVVPSGPCLYFSSNRSFPPLLIPFSVFSVLLLFDRNSQMQSFQVVSRGFVTCTRRMKYGRKNAMGR